MPTPGKHITLLSQAPSAGIPGFSSLLSHPGGSRAGKFSFSCRTPVGRGFPHPWNNKRGFLATVNMAAYLSTLLQILGISRNSVLQETRDQTHEDISWPWELSALVSCAV